MIDKPIDYFFLSFLDKHYNKAGSIINLPIKKDVLFTSDKHSRGMFLFYMT